MSSLLDLGGCPEIFVAGVANVFSRDGITYVMLYSWGRHDGTTHRIAVGKLVMKTTDVPTEWLRRPQPDEQAEHDSERNPDEVLN
jgi:hypothetical protein